jgi:hypothetical protein
MEHQGNVFNGMIWGALLSIPLWLTFFLTLKLLF